MPIIVNFNVLNEPKHANGGLTIIQTKTVLLKQLVEAKAVIRLHADQSFIVCIYVR